MKKGVGVCLLYLQTYLSLASGGLFLYLAGERVTLPCGMNSPGDIEWKKDGERILKIEKGKTILGATKDKTNQHHFSVPDGSTKDLQISGVTLIDSGNYTCEEKNKESRTVQVLVLQVKAVPSMNLLASEDLMLTINLPSGTSPIVSWRRDQKKIGDGPILRKDNVQIEDRGTYKAHVDFGDGLRKDIDVKIEVSGFVRSPSIVYISDRKRSLLLPWIFNFDVRKTPLEKEVRVLGGNITFSSQKIREMVDRGGAGCWEAECDTKIPEEQSKDLSFTLTNPRCGPYRMEILLQLGARQKRLTREVCVSNITVSASPAFFSMESNVTLACSVTCLDPEGKLCWGSNLIGQKVCGAPGQRTFTKNITAVPETLGNWTCNVLIGGNIAAGANLTLGERPPGGSDSEGDKKVTLSLFHPSGALFWVTVAVGVVVLLLLAVIVAVMAARCRRVRRARYRAWLLENLHQQRVCECNGFAPKRLRENV